ncbi:hypothetical protein BT69DRAFT_335330 [Atractiella rhizophila]|nr:hypothetical protein BT69DRAFT_335330 [Atractiella rhizophila]
MNSFFCTTGALDVLFPNGSGTASNSTGWMDTPRGDFGIGYCEIVRTVFSLHRELVGRQKEMGNVTEEILKQSEEMVVGYMKSLLALLRAVFASPEEGEHTPYPVVLRAIQFALVGWDPDILMKCQLSNDEMELIHLAFCELAYMFVDASGLTDTMQSLEGWNERFKDS